MEIFCCIIRNGKHADRLRRLLSEVYHLPNENICYSIDEFVRKLNKSVAWRPITIILPDTFLSDNGIAPFLKIKELLAKTFLLVVVEHSDEALIRKLHGLSPRYLTLATQDFTDLIQVIEHILKRKC